MAVKPTPPNQKPAAYAIAAFIMRGQLPAIFLTSILCVLAFFAPFTAILSGAIVGLVALRKGTLKALTLVIIASVPTLIMYQTGLGKPAIAVPLLLFLSLPIILQARALRISQSQGLATLVAVTITTLFIITMRLIYEDINLFWSQWLANTVKYVPGASVQGFVREGSLPFVNGLVSSMLTACMILTILISRWLQSTLYNPGAFFKEFCLLRIPKAAAWIALLALLIYAGLTFGKGNILSELLMIAAVAFTFQGLATLHNATQTLGLPRMWFLVAYLLLFLTPRFAISILSLAGLIDSFVDFRNRKPRKQDPPD